MNPIQYIKNLIKRYRYKRYEEEYSNLSEQEQSYWSLDMYQMQREALDTFFKTPSPCAMFTMALMDHTRQTQPQWTVMMKVMDAKMRKLGKFKPQSFVLETMYSEMFDEIMAPSV